MKIVLASNNKGKLRELGELLADHDIELVPQGELDIPEAVEDGLSFVENAILKARHACALSGLPAIADDSGLEVDALRGAPGIHSARYAGTHGDDAANNRKLLEALREVPDEDRTARFQCVMVFMRHAKDPTPMVCQGSWEGRILHEPRGENGFGYDPLFWVPDENATAAELPAGVKNALSHRGKALRELMRRLTERGL
ncbi:RdgB/HAM1 family non-canonical purine NTP pyrophosphatase [endosymbiont of unidentified scaly snail isolate Monju]|uniref:RdgB/HAM1 family non-canonical purine NTP pyrophosphatase n=1 Tax=endosymbiont of unidentified scaly snail isolate Monju TaxID=1248727 RepID=UPI000389289F|nr:RdgB/HAM1 family non-canonical purine NTP pyrophosphatase [endosymbiont of unidentified scaly snail isolate Monju]BAN69922.1 nucleoside-triphosphatase THEP1 [endosymbiont of unidentified scaly snail isolate Monju]